MISGASATVPVAPGAPAGPARRLLAAPIDWLLCYLLPSLAALAYVSVIGLAIVPVCVVAYFAFFLFRGQTPGMRVASICVVDQRTGRAPRAAKALVRAVTALLQAVAVLALLNFGFSDTPDGGYSHSDLAIFVVASVVALSALVAHLWMFLDRRHQTLLDRAFRVEVERRL